MSSSTASEQKKVLFELRKRLRKRLQQIGDKKAADEKTGPSALTKPEKE